MSLLDTNLEVRHYTFDSEKRFAIPLDVVHKKRQPDQCAVLYAALFESNSRYVVACDSSGVNLLETKTLVLDLGAVDSPTILLRPIVIPSTRHAILFLWGDELLGSTRGDNGVVQLGGGYGSRYAVFGIHFDCENELVGATLYDSVARSFHRVEYVKSGRTETREIVDTALRNRVGGMSCGMDRLPHAFRE